MKLLKTLTTFSLIFALFTLHIETGAISWSRALSRDDINNIASEELERAEPDQDFSPEPSGTTTTTTSNTSSSGGDTSSSQNSLDYSGASCSIGKMTVNQFMLMVTLMLGPIVGLSCFSLISGKIFAGGASIYLIKEIMNYNKFKGRKTSNEEMLATLDGNTEDAQIQTFLLAEQQERDAAEALGARASNAKLLSTAMYLAATAATVEFIVTSVKYGVCTAASIGTGACACGQATAFFDRCGAPKTPCESPAERTIWAINFTPDMFSDVLVADSGRNISEQYACYKAEDENLYDLESFIAYNQTYSEPQEPQNLDQETMFQNALKAAVSIFLGNAYAKESEDANKGGILSALGISGLVIGIVAAFMLRKQVTFQAVLSVGWVRALLFGGLGLFASFAAKELEKAKDCANGSADVYKNLADQLERALMMEARMAGMIKPSIGIRNQIQNARAERDNLNGLGAGAVCMIGNLGEYRLDPKCECRKTNTCSTAKFDTTELSNLGLPSSFGSSLGAFGNGANSLFSGNLAGADSSFGTLGQNAANIERLRKKSMENAIASLKKDKKFEKQKFNIEKADEALGKMLKDDLNKSVNDILSSSGSGAGTLAASSAVPSLDSAVAKDPKDLKQLVASIQGNAKAPAKDSGAGQFKFDFGDEAASDQNIANPLNQGDALSDFESNESDISDRPNESIFKIITVRYFKSAYPRFFTEEAQGERQELD